MNSKAPINRKRPAPTNNTGGGGGGAKRIQIGGGGGAAAITVGASGGANNSNHSKVKSETYDNDNSSRNSQRERVKNQFMNLFKEAQYAVNGVPNSVLKEIFNTPEQFNELVPIINELTSSARLTMSQTGSGASSTTPGGGGNKTELYYNLVSTELASSLGGLDPGARMVYHVIQKAGNVGIWTKFIRSQTNIEQQTLNKIFKVLEQRQLIKPVKNVNAKSKKLYMLYELTPSTEITGGIWYSDLEFDHEFINELRTFILQCIRRVNKGKGVSCEEIMKTMFDAKVSKVELTEKDLQQILRTLLYDHLIEMERSSPSSSTGMTTTLYVAARKVTPNCEFKFWDTVFRSDFKYHNIQFDDGITLMAHEPHYHT